MLRPCLFLIAVVLFCLPTASGAAASPGNPGATDQDFPSPQQLLGLCGDTLLPVEYTIEKDEIVTSDTDPARKLRRIEVKFYSQQIDGAQVGSPVGHLPARRPAGLRGQGPSRQGRGRGAAELGRPGHRALAKRVPGQLRRADRLADRLSHDDLPHPRRV